MTVSGQLARLRPYLGRLLEDEYIQGQLGQAITGLRRSSRRAKGQSASEALKDRRLRSQLRDTVNSLHEAASAIQGKRAKRKRKATLLVRLLAAAGTGAALAWRAKSAHEDPPT